MAAYSSSVAGGDTAGSGARSVAITPAANDLLVIVAGFRGITGTPSPTCSDNQSGTYTLATSGFWGASGAMFAVFVRDSLVSSAVSHTVTVDMGSNTSGNVVAVALSGMTKTGSTAIKQTAKQENQSSGTPAPAFSVAATTTNPTIGAVFDNLGPPNQTAPTGWTERVDTNQITPTNGIEVVTRDSGFTGTTVTWGASESGVFGSVIIELDASSSGGTTFNVSAAASVATVAGVKRATTLGTISDAVATVAGVKRATTLGTISASVATVAGVVRNTALKTISAAVGTTAAATAQVVHVFLVTVSATVGTTAAVKRQAGITVAATAGTVGAVLRASALSVRASVASVAGVKRAASLRAAAAVSTVGGVVRRAGIAVAGTVATVAAAVLLRTIPASAYPEASNHIEVDQEPNQTVLKASANTTILPVSENQLSLAYNGLNTISVEEAD